MKIVIKYFAICCLLLLTGTKITIATPTGFDWDKHTCNKHICDKHVCHKRTCKMTPMVNSKKLERSSQESTSMPEESSDDSCETEHYSTEKASPSAKEPRPIRYHLPRMIEDNTSEDDLTEEIFECPLCIEEKSCSRKKRFPCCDYEICKNCEKKLLDFEEKKDDLGTVHPKSIRYADQLSTTKEINEIMRYHAATPEIEPEWKWYKINGKYYFLEDNTLWRYAREKSETDKQYLYSWHWRYIVPPRCPQCYKTALSCLKKYKVKAKCE